MSAEQQLHATAAARAYSYPYTDGEGPPVGCQFAVNGRSRLFTALTRRSCRLTMPDASAGWTQGLWLLARGLG
jgi:hypothetical protein